MTPLEVLDLPMDPSEPGASTIRGYMVALLGALWTEQEGFSGKQALIDSGCRRGLHRALLTAGAVNGSLAGDGYIEEIDSDAADALIAAAISAMAAPPTPGNLLSAAVAAEEEAKIFSRRADRLRQEADSYRLCAEVARRRGGPAS